MNFVAPQNLLNKNFIANYFAKKITDQKYKNTDWQSIKITPIKKALGQFYHLVIRYDVEGLVQPIFCTAHSKENRFHAYKALEYIDDHAFFKGKILSLAPLFYDQEYKALFYLGIDGKNLLYYIKEKEEKVAATIKLTAKWLAELHSIKTDLTKHNFNPLSSQVETVVPGANFYLEKIKAKQPAFSDDIKKIFSLINEFDQNNLKSNQNWLIHGDLHPENVIVNSHDESEITIIDYTDICMADFARDLGSFLQQLEYMINRFNSKLAAKTFQLQKTFLNEYFKQRRIEPSLELKKRISMYMAWTALRSAVFFLTKSFIETREADKLLRRAYEYIDTANKNTLAFY